MFTEPSKARPGLVGDRQWQWFLCLRGLGTLILGALAALHVALLNARAAVRSICLFSTHVTSLSVSL